MKVTDVSKEDFMAYEGIRESGMYNMFDPRARDMAGLDRKVWATIIHHYDELCELYPGVRK